MKRFLSIVAASLVAASVALAADEYAPDEVIVKFRSGVSLSAMGFLQAKSVNRFSAGTATRRARVFTEKMQNWAVVKLRDGMTVEQALTAFRSNPNVEIVVPNHYARAFATPNDTHYATQQWSLDNTGQSILGTDGTPGADIHAAEAWDIETGASNEVIVAVADSGVDYLHPDLAANMWTNPLEVPGDGIDNDGNGFIDDVHGARILSPASGDPMDDYDHGTHVAGIIGAVSNNGAGVAGVCWNVKIMAVKFLDSSGVGSVSNGVLAIQYAVAKGANVINNSWGVYLDNQALHDAVIAARAAGVVVTAAAGNNDTAALVYPAAYPEVVAVAGTGNRDENYKKNRGSHIDVAAPGKNVLSTIRNNQYGYMTGTSMATPHVSGAAALLKARNTSLTPDQIQALLSNSVDVPAGWDDRYGPGRLNIHRSLLSMDDTTPPTVSILQPANNSYVAKTLTFEVAAADNLYLSRVQFFVDGVIKSTATVAPFTKEINIQSVPDGTYTIMAKAIDGAGNTATSSVQITVVNGDLVAPTVTITSPADGATIGDTVAVTADAADNHAVSSVGFFIDGSSFAVDATAPYSADLNTAALTSGPHEVMARATDISGNVSTHTITVTVSNFDPTPPTVNLTAPSDGSTIGGTITVSADASDNLAVSKVWFLVDGVVGSTDTAAPYNWAFDTTNVSDGGHTISARAFDAAGNVADDAVAVTIQNNDTIKPTAAITSPANGATVAGTIVVTATATDNIGVERVGLVVDGNVLIGTTTTTPYEFAFNTGAFLNGPHQLSVVAVDFSGNIGTHTISVSIQNVDTSSPTVSITSPVDGAALGGIVTVRVDASDNLAVLKVWTLIDGVVRSTDTTSPYDFTFNALLEDEGPHTISARAFDAAGNFSQHTIDVTFAHQPTDFTAPTVEIVTPLSGSSVSGEVSVIAAVSDNNSVSRVELYVDGVLRGTDAASPYLFTWDATGAADGPHTITVKGYDPDENVGSASVTVLIGSPASALSLFQPLFNPARGEELTIPLSLAGPAHVKARIVDRFGAEVVSLSDGDKAPGDSITWDGRNDSRDVVASGAYILILEVNGSRQTKKIIIRK